MTEPVSQPSLAERLTQQRQALRTEAAGAQYWERFSRLYDDFLARARQQPVLAVGARVPAVTLLDPQGEPLPLAELFARGPLVLAFYRGRWCPYCGLELRALDEAWPQLAELGAELALVSPQTPEQSLRTRHDYGLRCQVLSDPHNAAARAFGLVFRTPADLAPLELPAINGDESYELPVPATFVIARDGTVAYAFVEFDYSYRADPVEITQVLRRLQAAGA